MEYEVVYRNIRYPRIEFKTEKPVLILPHGYPPEELLEKHKEWLRKKMAFVAECLAEGKKIKLEDRKETEFRALIFTLLERLSQEVGQAPKKVFFRTMRSKWASLSPEGNLTVNTIMRYLPEYLVEYVIFHELVHFREKRHNGRFWDIIASRYEDYRKKEKELFSAWFAIQKKEGEHGLLEE